MKDLFSVAGKVVIVTGGSRGIGEMIAAGFLANGAKVYISSRKAETCDATAERLMQEFGGECISLPADLSNVAGIEGFAKSFEAKESRLDVLINNAGVWGASYALDDLDKSLLDYEHILGTNLKGEYLFGRAVIPIMLEQGKGGEIVLQKRCNYLMSR